MCVSIDYYIDRADPWRGGSRERVQEVRTPSPQDDTFEICLPHHSVKKSPCSVTLRLAAIFFQFLFFHLQWIWSARVTLRMYPSILVWNPTYNLKTYSGRSFAAHYFWILYPNLSKIQHHLTLLNVDSKSIFSWVLITADADFYCFIVVLHFWI